MTTYPTLTPHLAVRDAGAAIEFYVSTFGATEVQRFTLPDGSVPHAELQFGDALVTVGEAMSEYEQEAPTQDGNVQGALTWLVPDVDALFAGLTDAGCRTVAEPADGPFGMRSATVRDPYGHRWILGTHQRDVPVDEQQKAFREMTGQG